MQTLVRPFVAIGLVVAALSSFVLARRTSAPLISGTAIHQINGESLTAIKVTVATPVQDVRPMALQRGVNLDGGLHHPPAEQMVIAGNPFEDAWRAPSIGGISLATGTYEVQCWVGGKSCRYDGVEQ